MKGRRLALVGSAALLLLLLGLATPAQAGGSRTVRITVTNLTSGQTLSPPLFAVGTNPNFFTVGLKARAGLAIIAEEGNNVPFAEALEGRPGVSKIIPLIAPIGPGGSISIEVELSDGDRLSLATMLVQTNDGFVGVSRLNLDGIGHASIALRALDAGSENNNELAEYIPGPPFDGHLRDPEGAVVHYHDGIMGVGDLDPKIYDWAEPAAMLEIEMV